MRLYYCPRASRKLYSVATDALLNPILPETQIAAVRDEDAKPASDGLDRMPKARIYATDYENEGIKRRAASGTAYETLVRAPARFLDGHDGNRPERLSLFRSNSSAAAGAQLVSLPTAPPQMSRASRVRSSQNSSRQIL